MGELKHINYQLHVIIYDGCVVGKAHVCAYICVRGRMRYVSLNAYMYICVHVEYMGRICVHARVCMCVRVYI